MNDKRSASDQEFVNGVRQRDEKSWEDLYYSFAPRLQRRGRRFLRTSDRADDYVQNVFLRAWATIDTFRGDSSIHTWLYRVANNLLIDEIRHSDRHPQHRTDEPVDTSLHEVGTADTSPVVQILLDQLLPLLKPKELEVLILRVFDELTWTEIAEITDTPETTCRDIYARSLKTLREGLSR